MSILKAWRPSIDAAPSPSQSAKPQLTKELPHQPAAPRAPAVLARLPGLQRELADLKLQVAERVLAVVEGAPGARERLSALAGDIRALEFAIEGNGLAHELAQRLDVEAVAEWRRLVDAHPVEATAGITTKKCCNMCSEAHGCVITGAQCAHPITVGTVGPRLQDSTAARALFRAAQRQIQSSSSGAENEGDAA